MEREIKSVERGAHPAHAPALMQKIILLSHDRRKEHIFHRTAIGNQKRSVIKKCFLLTSVISLYGLRSMSQTTPISNEFTSIFEHHGISSFFKVFPKVSIISPNEYQDGI